MARHSFLVQFDTDDMEYHAKFNVQKLADRLLATMYDVAKDQKLAVAVANVDYLGSN